MPDRQNAPHARGWTAHGGQRPEGGRTPGRTPRTRGDGPCAPAGDSHAGDSPPLSGFPAHAGMDHLAGAPTLARPGLPRTRGDGPRHSLARLGERKASPHTRGWTRMRALMRSVSRGFPAHAGMDPGQRSGLAAVARLPRTRGDEPLTANRSGKRRTVQPRARGETKSEGGIHASKEKERPSAVRVVPEGWRPGAGAGSGAEPRVRLARQARRRRRADHDRMEKETM